ncbi:hypothetical protein PoB_007289300 [Plakobranchus ocellatus]|uniref:Uncharacterized protein n=1 Tax=Plakobranchus ocellatus TaxID=259542 RepID=A0AAV4DQQ8_9GAST|nr:hypothetical protein PoB_007289300 [Plakobranchus ocellatus]
MWNVCGEKKRLGGDVECMWGEEKVGWRCGVYVGRGKVGWRCGVCLRRGKGWVKMWSLCGERKRLGGDLECVWVEKVRWMAGAYVGREG